MGGGGEEGGETAQFRVRRKGEMAGSGEQKGVGCRAGYFCRNGGERVEEGEMTVVAGVEKERNCKGKGKAAVMT